MSKYRLKKWYPSLPKHVKEGIVVEWYGKGGSDYIVTETITGGLSVPKNEVENNPEFWEKVCDDCGKPIKEEEDIKWKHDCHCKEKDYKILKFRNKNNHSLAKRRRVGGAPDEGFPNKVRFDCQWEMYRPTIKELLDNDDWEIYSVKRLFDGEVFTIGDKTNAGNLTGFSINKQNDIITHHNPSGEDLNDDYYLGGLEHREPLFTTKDGVDIYEGDDYWYVTDNYTMNRNIANVQSGANFNVQFSTKEKAREYVDEKKIIFTTKDGVDMYRDDKFYVVTKHSNITVGFAESGYIPQGERFYHKEKAEQHLEEVRPRFSKADVRRAFNNSRIEGSFHVDGYKVREELNL